MLPAGTLGLAPRLKFHTRMSVHALPVPDGAINMTTAFTRARVDLRISSVVGLKAARSVAESNRDFLWFIDDERA
jgi:hypothetical protein